MKVCYRITRQHFQQICFKLDILNHKLAPHGDKMENVFYVTIWQWIDRKTGQTSSLVIFLKGLASILQRPEGEFELQRARLSCPGVLPRLWVRQRQLWRLHLLRHHRPNRLLCLHRCEQCRRPFHLRRSSLLSGGGAGLSVEGLSVRVGVCRDFSIRKFLCWQTHLRIHDVCSLNVPCQMISHSILRHLKANN